MKPYFFLFYLVFLPLFSDAAAVLPKDTTAPTQPSRYFTRNFIGNYRLYENGIRIRDRHEYRVLRNDPLSRPHISNWLLWEWLGAVSLLAANTIILYPNRDGRRYSGAQWVLPFVPLAFTIYTAIFPVPRNYRRAVRAWAGKG